MKIGTIFFRSGQAYRYLGDSDHWTLDDRHIQLAHIESRCADCDAPFEFRTTRSTMRSGKSLNRRCKAHRAIGRPVSPCKPRKAHKRAVKGTPPMTAKKRTPVAWPPLLAPASSPPPPPSPLD